MTVTVVPFATGIAPGLIRPVPPAKEAVSVAEPPAVIVVATGAKLEINGKANTVRLAVP